MERKSYKNLEGQKFGRWLVLKRQPNVGNVVVYECICDCGTVRDVRAMHFTSGRSVSCGCYSSEVASIRNLKHGQARTGQFTRKYRAWRAIRDRCNNPKHKNADIYHGLLCDRWQEFKNFDEDVPDPESDDLSIDRIDNSKGYEPGNVRWITMAEQHRNQTNCRWIEFNGEKRLLSDWAKALNISVPTLIERIDKHGIEKALTMPKMKNQYG